MKEVNSEQTDTPLCYWQERKERDDRGRGGGKMKMQGAQTNTRRIFNSYLILWESDHANPLL